MIFILTLCLFVQWHCKFTEKKFLLGNFVTKKKLILELLRVLKLNLSILFLCKKKCNCAMIIFSRSGMAFQRVLLERWCGAHYPFNTSGRSYIFVVSFDYQRHHPTSLVDILCSVLIISTQKCFFEK